MADFCVDPEALILFMQKDSKIHSNIPTKQTLMCWSMTQQVPKRQGWPAGKPALIPEVLRRRVGRGRMLGKGLFDCGPFAPCVHTS